MTSYFCIAVSYNEKDMFLERDLTECGQLEKGMANNLQYSWLENLMNSMKRQKDRTLKDERMEPKQKQYPAVDRLVIEARSDAVKSNIA